ncbi:hypothetical protein LOC71_19930 [Rhodopirellula sp. JC740]|uniref:Uncharacterized protein n=1 Tax=Rhodopirellula halodulae TaxID=2894198 RepID=A0ABS8NLU4_9BACT|nr:hypothetical protein [Rhodopirellula sp. JC740]MCC9644549.1 hypothetical protein [Rhodopirellula sp. JC740]
MTIYAIRFLLFVSIAIAFCTNAMGQFIERRTHLAPPAGAFNADDYERWDVIACRTAVFSEFGISKVFTAELSRERLEKTPSWDELDPKVSAGTALRLAKRQIDTLKPYGELKCRYELQLQEYWGEMALGHFAHAATTKRNANRLDLSGVRADGRHNHRPEDRAETGSHKLGI